MEASDDREPLMVLLAKRRRGTASSHERDTAPGPAASSSTAASAGPAAPSAAPTSTPGPMPMPHLPRLAMRWPEWPFTEQWLEIEDDNGGLIRRVHPDSLLGHNATLTSHSDYDAIMAAWSDGCAFTNQDGHVYPLELVAQQVDGIGQVVLKDGSGKQFAGNKLTDQTLVTAFRDDNMRPVDYQVICDQMRDSDFAEIVLPGALVGWAKRDNFVLPWRDF